MICHFNTRLHDGRDVLPVAKPMTSQVLLMCFGCRTVTEWRVVDRRVTDLPVIHERRGWKPVWLRRGSTKVLDHGNVA